MLFFFYFVLELNRENISLPATVFTRSKITTVTRRRQMYYVIYGFWRFFTSIRATASTLSVFVIECCVRPCPSRWTSEIYSVFCTIRRRGRRVSGSVRPCRNSDSRHAVVWPPQPREFPILCWTIRAYGRIWTNS